MNREEFICHAREYLKYGFSVFPVGRNKKPLIKTWKEFQTRKPSDEEIILWAESIIDPNIAIVTGQISEIIVIDVDKGGDKSPFPPTVISITGGGGFHLFYKYPGEDVIRNFVRKWPNIDVRGEGGYVVAPPSLHLSGSKYEWLVPPQDAEIVDLPQEYVQSLSEQNFVNTNWEEFIQTKNGEGTRNTTAAKYIGKIVSELSPEFWETIGWVGLKEWNETQNDPPLDLKELRTTFDSIAKREIKNHQNEKLITGQSEKPFNVLMDIVEEEDVELFLDENGEPFATIREKPTIGIPLSSRMFEHWLRSKYYNKTHKGTAKNPLSDAIGTLAGKALNEGDKRKLWNRVARIKDTIIYDIGDDQTVVVIDRSGWKITNASPVLFRRYKHQIQQVIPKQGGDLKALLKYTNITDPTSQILFLTYVVTLLVPKISRVLLVHTGKQGSAKSTGQKLVRSLADPSRIDLLPPPGDLNELAQMANQHYCLFFDNVSYIKADISDALCRLSTGVGFTKRKLYTDDDEVIFDQKVAVGLTGISQVIERADLLERSLLLEFERITEENRRDEEELLQEFEQEKPYILGAVFTAVSKSLDVLPTVKLSKKPRMADYAKYGAAAAIALGYSSEQFLVALSKNTENQHKNAIDSSSLAQTILFFMSDKEKWDGSSTRLYELLHEIAMAHKFRPGKNNDFPEGSNWLWKRIKKIEVNLMAYGIHLNKSDVSASAIITITKTSGGMGAVEAFSESSEQNNTQLDNLIDHHFDTNKVVQVQGSGL